MTMKFQCPECSDSEMSLAEDTHSCECGHTLSVDEANAAFEAGEIVGLVDESEVTEHEDVIVADMSEDVQALVEGLELSEELADKAKTILESAVTSRVKAEVKTIEEKAEAYAEYVKETLEEEMVEKIDGYLSHVVSEWLEENKLAVETGVKTEMDESFIEGLAGLLKEHYVQAPEQRWDIVEGLATKVEDLEAKLDESMDATITAKHNVQEAEKAIAVMKLSEGLAETQKEKLLELAEGVDAESAEDFKAKLETLKESYFKAETKEEAKLDEEVTEDEVVSESKTDMSEVLRILSRK